MDQRTLALAALLSAAAACFGQIPQVKTWQNAADGVRTQISITAKGRATPTPVLLFECTQPPAKKPLSIGIYLITGPLEPHPKVGLLNSVSEWLLRVDFAGGKPAYLSWPPSRQPGTYLYEGQGANGMATEYKSPSRFLDDLLTANAFSVEYQRKGDRRKQVATFDTSKLKAAFEGRAECGSRF